MSKFVDTANISLDENEIARYMGMPSDAVDEDMHSLISWGIDLFKSKIRPCYVCGVFSKSENSEGILLAGTKVVLKGENIKVHLQGAEKVVVFACTLGAAAERLIREAAVQDLVKSLVLDATATEFIEKVCDKLEKIIMHENAPQGYTSNFRFGPGYGDLPLDIQPKILAALDAQKQIALYCNENNIMTPSKSVTGILGLFNDETVQKQRMCDICQFNKTCNKKEGC